jgi:hypothetical protein
MESLNENEMWRIVPPEEKLDMLARAQTSGFSSAVIFVIIGWTIAVSLALPWLIWTSLVLTPFVFQFSASRMWRTLRPKTMLEYLAARSAARRFAFQVRGRDLNIILLFRGSLEHVYEKAEDAQKMVEEDLNNVRHQDVWIGLFRDTIICMAEGIGGAHLELGVTINEKLVITSSDKGAYAKGKEITLTSQTKGVQGEQKYRITSRHPAALVVFEKKILQLQDEEAKKLMKVKSVLSAGQSSSLF